MDPIDGTSVYPLHRSKTIHLVLLLALKLQLKALSSSKQNLRIFIYI